MVCPARLSVSGRVLTSAGRAPVNGATVSLAGQNTMTTGAGTFSFANVSLNSGNMITVSKSGYATHSGTVPAPAGATAVTLPDVLLAVAVPNKPSVTAIRPRYDGRFLSSASLLNQYTASVDWNGKSPATVEFYVNSTLARTVPASATETTADIDMAQGFVGSFTRDANKISAVAVSSDGTRSATYAQPITVLPLPEFLLEGGTRVFDFIEGSQPALSWEFEFPMSSQTARDLQQIPFIGQFGPAFSFDVAFDYELRSGEWGLFAGKDWGNRLHHRSGARPNSVLLPRFYFGNVDFKWGLGGKAEGVASFSRGIELQRAPLEGVLPKSLCQN